MARLAPTILLPSGSKLPALGLGTWKSEPGKVYEAVKTAIEAGYRHIDCAFGYNNEGEVGRAIEEMINRKVVERKDLWITSKCWNTYHSKTKAIECCQISLKNLRVDYLDLYLIHWPMGYKEGGDVFPKNEKGEFEYSDVDYLETWEALEELHSKGLVRNIGLSNFNSEQITRVLGVAKIKPNVLQVECHPYLNQSQLLEFCKKNDIVMIAYSPLGSPDRPWAKPDDPLLMEEPTIKAIAEAHGKSPAQVLLRYQVDRGLAVIAKSVTKERIISNFEIFDFTLTPGEIKSIDGLNCNRRLLHLSWIANHKYYPFHAPF
uniref:Putative aldo/keto reductase family n=1 Tax=Ornithodoros turicata TaxID=34597 RepID=A0A2R5LNT6_9ACAR